jgi:hypothetical protein
MAGARVEATEEVILDVTEDVARGVALDVPRDVPREMVLIRPPILFSRQPVDHEIDEGAPGR